MSVLVKGMKMPENCETCEYQTKGACFASGVNKGTITIRRMDKERPDWCPLAEVKTPHGRLIDADALNLDYEVEMADDWKTAHEIANCIKYATTVIEPEGEG